MGCGGSKIDDLPLVALCKERKDLIREASERRYDLAAAHISYFRALRNIGEALRHFVDEEVSVGSSSPLLNIPSSEGKTKTPSSSNSLSHHLSEDSHLSLGSDSDDQSENTTLHSEDRDHDHDHLHFSPPSSSSPVTTYYQNYMRSSSSTAIPSVIYEQPSPYYFGGLHQDRPASPPPAERISPPSPPTTSSWEFLNPFNSSDNLYPDYGYSYGYGGYGFGPGSDISSPDSSKVREKEGIPDLEDETETEQAEAYSPLPKQSQKDSRQRKHSQKDSRQPKQSQKDSREPKQSQKENVRDEGAGTSKGSVENVEIKSSGIGESSSKNVAEEEKEEEEEVGRKKGVIFEMETSAGENIESIHGSSSTILSSIQLRDIREAVEEIRAQFIVASDCGKEVAAMLEASKVRYRQRHPIFKAISCRILDVVPPMSASSLPSRTSKTWRNRSTDYESGMKAGSLLSTLDKLYAWEKKLYKEVKDEEKLRVVYEKQCKRLKRLDDKGAESHKIDATQASIRKLLTKLSIAIKAVDAIASRIHKLRDEELQPQLIELFQGFMRMWKNVMKCHKKQFQAILESKNSNFIGKTRIKRDSNTKATTELEVELFNWCSCFEKWITTQRACIAVLNEWLLKCLLHEPEITPDGIVPFSPGRIGAPPVFIICHDWCNAMMRISEAEVTQGLQNFASSVHRLWERQDEERRQKLKAEYLSRDFERVKSLQGNRELLDKKSALVSNEGGVVELDSMKKRLDEERAKHVEAVKQVHEAVAGSMETGLVPIFEAVDKFTSEVVKGCEGVRTQTERST